MPTYIGPRVPQWAITVDAQRASLGLRLVPLRGVNVIHRHVKMAAGDSARGQRPNLLSTQDMANVLEEFLHRKSVLEGLPGHEYSRLRNLYQALKTELTDENHEVGSNGRGT